MELNGVANLHCIVDLAKAKGEISEDAFTEIKIQLDTLERYMIAHSGRDIKPYWHEVRDNKNLYKNNRGETK